MLSRILQVGLAAAVVLSVTLSGAAAADLAAEKVTVGTRANNLLGRCSAFNNYFLWGDPTDCANDETVPACDAPAVVGAALRFAGRAEKAYRVPRVKELRPVRELGQPLPNPSELVRRYCEGSALLNTATDPDRWSTAYYFVEEDAGFVGLSWTVYVCLDGYDDWRVYDGRCRVARPAPAD